MASRVLPKKEIQALLASNFVCVKIDADSVPSEIEPIMKQGNGKTLPFYAYLTPEGNFISGTSGYRGAAEFAKDLQSALRSEPMRASPNAQASLAAAAEQAEKDFKAKKYPAVLLATQEALEVRGWSDSKAKLRELGAKCEEIGQVRLAEALALVRKGNLKAASGLVRSVQKEFAETTIGRTADLAVSSIRDLEAAAQKQNAGDMAGASAIYASIAKDAEGTPYEAIAKEKLAKLPK